MISIFETNETITGSFEQDDWEDTWADHWTPLNNTDKSTFTGSEGSGGGISSDTVTIISIICGSWVGFWGWLLLFSLCIGGVVPLGGEDIVSPESRMIFNILRGGGRRWHTANNDNSHHRTVTELLRTRITTTAGQVPVLYLHHKKRNNRLRIGLRLSNLVRAVQRDEKHQEPRWLPGNSGDHPRVRVRVKNKSLSFVSGQRGSYRCLRLCLVSGVRTFNQISHQGMLGTSSCHNSMNGFRI